MRDDTTLAQLHDIIQALFDWHDEHLHDFHIFGKDDGTSGADTRAAILSQFRLRKGERFHYVYDYDAYWVCDIRLEAILPVDPKRFYPVCTGGKNASPSENFEDVQAYMTHIDRYLYNLPVESPRFEHCPCQADETQSFSPLAVLLPEHTTPELLYLESKWAALASYGMTVKMLEDVLPMDGPLLSVTIRNHVLKLAERLEDELGEEKGVYIEGCPRDWGELPIPDGPLTVGIDGGYVKAQGMDQNVFEVIAGKSILSFRRDEDVCEPSSQAFAFVQTYDDKPKRRLFEHLQAQGMQMNQQIEFLSDGSDDVRDIQLYLSPEADHLLDWFPRHHAPHHVNPNSERAA